MFTDEVERIEKFYIDKFIEYKNEFETLVDRYIYKQENEDAASVAL